MPYRELEKIQYRGGGDSGKGLSLKRWVKVDAGLDGMDDYMVVDGCVSGWSRYVGG